MVTGFRPPSAETASWGNHATADGSVAMAGMFLEREDQLEQLSQGLAHAGRGRGAVFLVTGAGGEGKTTLLRRFIETLPGHVRLLSGVCDDGEQPARPTGAFHDLLSTAFTGAQRGTLGADVAGLILNEIRASAQPMVIVLDDAHWADAATLDAVRYVGRRISRMPAMLAVAYRERILAADHPLRLALGTVPAADVRRIRLPALSYGAVANLAGDARAPAVYELTCGNPFFVQEVLACPDEAVPQKVQDAVLADVCRLSAQARRCVEMVAVLADSAERAALADFGVVSGVEQAARAGLLVDDGVRITFTNELARQAVESSLDPPLRRELHQAALDVLGARNVDPSTLVRHAVGAENPDAVTRHARAAARAARERGEYTMSCDFLEHALGHAAALDVDTHADLLDEYSWAAYLIGRHERAASVLEQAVVLHGERADDVRLGAALCLLSDVRWFLGFGREAADAAERAVGVLEKHPRCSPLARAYAQLSKLAMLDFRAEDAIAWGDRAVELAREVGDSAVLASSLTSVGVVTWQLGERDNGQLIDSIRMAREHGLNDEAARGYVNLANGHINLFEYEQAALRIDEGLTFCQEHELLGRAHYLLATRAWWNLEQGLWFEAERDLDALCDGDDVGRVRAMGIRATILMRRGDDGASKVLEEAKRLASQTGEAQHVMPVLFAQTEFAWLVGDRDATAAAARHAAQVAVETHNPRWLGEALLWCRRAGVTPEQQLSALPPFELYVAGDWRGAAQFWGDLGRVYEHADMLGEANDVDTLLEALHRLDHLGARPRAAMVRAKLSALGLRSVPRGPRRKTRLNPAGLTERQAQVLELLAEGLTYEEIARRLFLSVKTVDHHVAAVRAKLSVTTREAAVQEARNMGLLGDRSHMTR